LAQKLLEIDSALAERVGQGEVCGFTALESPWGALGGPLLSSYV